MLPVEDLSNMKLKNPIHFETLNKIRSKKKIKQNNYFDDKVKGFSHQGLDLLKKMLKIDPDARITAK